MNGDVMSVYSDVRKDLLFSSLAALVSACCFLLSLPYANLGFNDDWSYSYIALKYAETGRIGYTGWSPTLLLFQIPYGGLLVRIFGFSFDLFRWATLPFSMGCAVLLYFLGRLTRLEPRVALFGTLTIITSPLFTPLSTSFMTDVYGLFFALACLYCGVRAFLSQSDRVVALWLTMATALGFLGGANRQLVWVAPVAVLLVFFWEKRSRRSLLLIAAALMILLLLGVLQVMHWFKVQPNVLYEVPDPTKILHSLRKAKVMIRLPLGGALFLLPVLLYHLPTMRKIPAWYFLFVGIGYTAYYFLPGEPPHSHLAPWLSNIVMPEGILGTGQDLAGRKPVVLNFSVRSLISAVVIGTVSIWLFHLCRWLRFFIREGFGNGYEFWIRYKSFASQILLFAIFSVACLLLNLNLPYWGFADRYLLSVLPIFAILILKIVPNPRARFASAAGWITLVLFAAYGVATTHDYFSTSRARVQATNLLHSAGIPRDHICAGFEFDGWTQLLATGYVHEPTAGPPANALHDPRPEWMKVPFWFLDRTPSIEPRYVVTYSPSGDLVSSKFPPISFTTWLPPFHRRLWIMNTNPEHWTRPGIK